MSSEALAALKKKSNNQILHSLFLLHKDNRKKRRATIQQATDGQIRALLKVLRLVWSGEVPLKSQEHLQAIKRSGKVSHLEDNFLYDESYKALKAKSVQQQKEVLKEICSWHELLYSIFKKKKKTGGR
jgi:hypothetical protein